VALNISQIANKVEALKRRNQDRDSRMSDILEVRRGNLTYVFPDMFPEGSSKAMIANFVDVAARDVSEVLAPLPSINCSTTKNNSDRARKAADVRTLIANNYIQFSRLQTQMYQGADWYGTYGFLPIVVEPDSEFNLPRIRVDNPQGSYPEFDRHNKLISYTKRYKKTIAELISDFPEYDRKIMGRDPEDVDYYSELELIRYEDAEQIVLFLPNRQNLVLNSTPNPMGEVMVRIAMRPSIDNQPRGQFDDVLWVQIARARFAQLAMDAAEKSINAPLAVPNDVQEFAFGPDAILRTAQPQNIRRVGLEVPPAAFAEAEILQREMRLGARYPEGRSGVIDASVITGQGVQALLGAFDTQVKTGQQILADVFEDVIQLCFKMDEKLFPGSKKITATTSGTKHELNYNSRVDINGDYSIEIRYGLMSGLDPSRALIFSLQALGAELISRDFVMRELPWSMNVSGEQEQIDVQKMRDNLNASISAMAQAIPQMTMQGQDPSTIVMKIAEVIKERQKGTSIEDAVEKAFAPEPPKVAPAEETTAAPVEQSVPSAPVEAPPGAPTSEQGEAEVAQQQQSPPNIEQVLGQLIG
jgi:hypothetical protein